MKYLASGLMALDLASDLSVKNETLIPLAITSAGDTYNVIQDHEGNYIVTTREFIEVDEIDANIHTRPSLVKLNSDYEVLWQYKSPREFSRRSELYLDILESVNEDGYIVIGQMPDLPVSLDNIPTITKFSLEGDVLWERQVRSLINDNSINVQGLIVDKFGHFVMCGSHSGAMGIDTFESFVQQWIFKFDDNGEVVFDDITDSVDDIFEDIKVYPNPSAAVIFIDQKLEQKITYQLFDYNGRLLESHDAQGSNVFMFDVLKYTSGNYVLKASDKNGNHLLVKKIFIE